MVIYLAQGANDMPVVQLMPLLPVIFCFIKIQNGLTFVMLAYHGCPGKEAVNVCLFVAVKA